MRVVARVVQIVELQVEVHAKHDADALQGAFVARAAALERGEELARVDRVDPALGRRVREDGRVVGYGRVHHGSLQVPVATSEYAGDE